MNAPSFLKNDKADEFQMSELTQLENLVSHYREREKEIEELESKLKEEKEAFRVISQEQIPALLIEHGFSEIRIASGAKVIVKEDASVNVPVEKRPAFFEFLKQRDEEDIIKLQFQFKKMAAEKQQKLFDFLEANNYDYEYERGVHPMTLKAYFKKILGIGEEDRAEGIERGYYLRNQDVETFANVFTYFSTKLK